MHAIAHTRKSVDNLQESLLDFYRASLYTTMRCILSARWPKNFQGILLAPPNPHHPHHHFNIGVLGL